MADRMPVSFRLSSEAKSLLEQLASRDGIDQVDVLNILLRERAREVGIVAKKEEQDDESPVKT